MVFTVDRPITERFWEKVNRTGPVSVYRPDLGQCWLWTKRLDKDGYGQFRIGSRTDGSSRQVGAHRLSYEWEYGFVPVGLELDHLCRVRACVRPSHLEAVTSLENIQRGNAGIHERLKTCCPRGHPYDDQNTYWRPNGNRECRTCTRKSSSPYPRKEVND